MRAVVKKNGVLIPRTMLKGAREVEVRDLGDRLIVVPSGAGDDPVFSIGRRPVRATLKTKMGVKNEQDTP
ncbi:MAG: hypothetical protein HY897_16080 [Deltaproteobacteria bacterium]|nr:hypothetical protein [Deltaproteobacteria bacterium]